MNARMAFALAVLVVGCGVALTQPPAPGPNIPPVTPPLATPPVIPTPPPPPTLDQLLDQLEQVQTQKAELAKREESLRQIIRKKLDEQDQRLKKLGLAPMPKEKEPDRVGRIIIEGNTKTPEKKILERLGFRPGQVLRYPSLEEARVMLQKAGFREVSIEVEPNDLNFGIFKDVHVKVKEADPAHIAPVVP